jgi:hypothetical protein
VVGVSEKEGDLHFAASTYSGLGVLAALQDRFEESGRWLVRSIATLLQDKQKLEAIWRDANLGAFPTEPNE